MDRTRHPPNPLAPRRPHAWAAGLCLPLACALFAGCVVDPVPTPGQSAQTAAEVDNRDKRSGKIGDEGRDASFTNGGSSQDSGATQGAADDKGDAPGGDVGQGDVDLGEEVSPTVDAETDAVQGGGA